MTESLPYDRAVVAKIAQLTIQSRQRGVDAATTLLGLAGDLRQLQDQLREIQELVGRLVPPQRRS